VISSPPASATNPLEDIFQFANIAKPPIVIVLKPRQECGRQDQVGPTLLILRFYEEVLHQFGDVVRAVVQRRQLQWNHRLSAVQIFTERPIFNDDSGGYDVKLPRT
jgi:hypothetical protein